MNFSIDLVPPLLSGPLLFVFVSLPPTMLLLASHPLGLGIAFSFVCT